jgi:hypothetical protein
VSSSLNAQLMDLAQLATHQSYSTAGSTRRRRRGLSSSCSTWSTNHVGFVLELSRVSQSVRRGNVCVGPSKNTTA